MRGVFAITLSATLAGCASSALWPGAERRLDRAALPALLRGGAAPHSAEDYGICGAALAVDRMARTGAPASPALAASTQGKLLDMTLRSPDPGLSFAIGEAVSEMPVAERRNLAARVPECRSRFGQHFR